MARLSHLFEIKYSFNSQQINYMVGHFQQYLYPNKKTISGNKSKDLKAIFVVESEGSVCKHVTELT